MATESLQAAKERQKSLCFISERMIPKDSSKWWLHIGKHILKALRQVAENPTPVNTVSSLALQILFCSFVHIKVGDFLCGASPHSLGPALWLSQISEALQKSLQISPNSLVYLMPQLLRDRLPHHALTSLLHVSSTFSQQIPNLYRLFHQENLNFLILALDALVWNQGG